MRVTIQHFVVTSMLAHAAIFAAWNSTPSQQLMIPAAEASAPMLNIALQNPERTDQKYPVQQHHQHRKIRQAHSSKPKPRRKIARRQKSRAEIQPKRTHSPSVVDSRSAFQAKIHRQEIRNRVLTRIRTDLRQYFVYPLLAQRRGWQGRVVLAFSVEANGMIRNIHIASGSGYPILDTSAATALSRVHQLYPGNNPLLGESMQLQLPVIFELQGG